VVSFAPDDDAMSFKSFKPYTPRLFAGSCAEPFARGALSAPSPLQIFVGPPDSSAMTALPWLLVPGFLVPILLFIHIVIVYRLLAQSKAPGPAYVWRGGGGQPKSA